VLTLSAVEMNRQQHASCVAHTAVTDVIPVSSVCLRVTRACNARCSFCLAPPDHITVSRDAIQRRLTWLRDAGIRKVHLCGGEPTIRHDLPEIVEDASSMQLQSALTTNGILLSPTLIQRLAKSATSVKVSLHGPAAVHDRMMGIDCFDAVTASVARLMESGVSTAIQTVVTRQQPDVHEWVIDYCLQHGVRKLRLIPFIPRGRGVHTAGEFQLDPAARDRLDAAVDAARRNLGDRLDVEILDFWRHDYYVVETDGRLQIQRETDAADATFTHIG
jgi:molybdenum cofactor biosynthesis enzyme MoaA